MIILSREFALMYEAYDLSQKAN